VIAFFRNPEPSNPRIIHSIFKFVKCPLGFPQPLSPSGFNEIYFY
jgi:hypothetical protein